MRICAGRRYDKGAKEERQLKLALSSKITMF
jgi:hypothetical protein